jgi:hypothetical protein
MAGSFVELADYRLMMHVKVWLVRWHRGAKRVKEGLVYRQSCAAPKATISKATARAIPFPSCETGRAAMVLAP